LATPWQRSGCCWAIDQTTGAPQSCPTQIAFSAPSASISSIMSATICSWL